MADGGLLLVSATYQQFSEQASAPANPAADKYRLYVNSSGQLVLRDSTGTETIFGAGGGGAPDDATYITQTPNGDLSAEQALSALSTGLLKVTTGTGVLSTAASGTDFAPATSGTAILKGNGSGGFSNAASGTDYAPATSGTAILKGDGSGAFSSATGGVDYANASHTHAASDLASGTVATARLGSGTANSSTYLRGDQTWATPSSGVTLQGSTPGSADTGNSNISGVSIVGKTAVGIASPSFGTANVLLNAANPTTADNAAGAIFGSTNTTNTCILAQGPASYAGNYISVQRSNGHKIFTINPYGSAAELRIYNADVQVASFYANTTETFLSSVGAYPTRIGANNAYQWEVTSAGHWVPYTSASRDIGTSSIRVRSGYFNNDLWAARVSLNNTSPSFGTYNTFILGTNMGIADNNGLMVGTIADGRKGIVLQEEANPNTTPLIEGQRLTGGRLFSFGNNASVGDIQIAYNGTTYGRFYWNTNTSLQAGSGQTLALGSNATDHVTLNTSGILATKATRSVPSALGTSGAVTLDCALSDNFTITPTGDTTINASNIVDGQTVKIRVLTSGTTSYTVTFGTGFLSTGTLATGTVTDKRFVIQFYSDGTSLTEENRTPAM